MHASTYQRLILAFIHRFMGSVELGVRIQTKSLACDPEAKEVPEGKQLQLSQWSHAPFNHGEKGLVAMAVRE